MCVWPDRGIVLRTMDFLFGYCCYYCFDFGIEHIISLLPISPLWFSFQFHLRASASSQNGTHWWDAFTKCAAILRIQSKFPTDNFSFKYTFFLPSNDTFSFFFIFFRKRKQTMQIQFVRWVISILFPFSIYIFCTSFVCSMAVFFLLSSFFGDYL